MFDIGKFFNDIGSGVNSFFNPRKKREDHPQPQVVNRQPSAAGLMLQRPGQPQGQAPVQPVPTAPVIDPVSFENKQVQPKPQVVAPAPIVPDALKTPQAIVQEKAQATQRARVTPQGTVSDTRPLPAQVPNDSFSRGNAALADEKGVHDVGNYYKTDADILRAELLKPNPDQNRVRGLTQSLNNRKTELATGKLPGVIQGVKNNQTIPDIASATGRSDREVQAVIDQQTPGYRQKTPLQGIGDFIGSTADAITDVIRKPYATADIAMHPEDAALIRNSLQEQYKTGQISPDRLKQEFDKSFGDDINHPFKVTDKGIEQTNFGDRQMGFTKDFVESGVNAASVLPAGKGIMTGKDALELAGHQIGQNATKEALITQAAKNMAVNQAKQATVYGTASTANDAIQGRPIDPASLAANYIAPVALGTAGETIGIAGSKILRRAPDAPVEPPRVVQMDRGQPIQSATPEIKPSPTQVPPDNTIIQPTTNRPAGALQKQIEDAHNIGDADTVQKLIPQLPPEMQAPMKSALGIKETKPQTIADLLPGLDDIKARANKPTEDPIIQLAGQHGIQPSTLDRLNAQYGEEKVNSILSRSSDATNIKNKDAFVTSEARKAFGEPPTQATGNVGETVNTTTGEIIPPQPAVQTNNLGYTDHIKGLPEDTAVNAEQARQLIGDSTEKLQTGLKNVDQYLQKNGSNYEEFSKDIQNANRTGQDPIPLHAEVYNKYLKPAFDESLAASGRANVGDQKWYLPQSLAGSEAPKTQFGGSIVNKLDTQNFGFASERQNKLDINEMDHTPEAHARYATQAVSERYRKTLDAEQVAKDVKERTGVDLTPEQATQVVEHTDNLAKKLGEAADNGGLAASGTEKINLVKDLSELGTAKAVPKFEVDQGLSGFKRVFSSSDELYKSTYTDASGKIRSLGDGTGFTRYTRADGQGYTLQHMAYQSGELNEPLLRNELTQRFADTGLGTDQVHEVIDKTINNLSKYDQQNLFKERNNIQVPHADTQAMDRAYVVGRAEKDIAREQMSQFLEGANIKSPQLSKNINADAKKMLIQDRAKTSLAEKLVNGATGTVYRGALGYNPVSALQNVTELRRAYSEFGEKGFVNAVTKATRDPKITARYGVKEIVVSHAAKDGKIETVHWRDLLKPMGMFNVTESIKDAILLHGLEAKHAALKGTAKTDAVLTDFEKLGFKGGKGGSLGFNKSKTGRLLGQFMQYQIKDWKLTGSKIGEATGRNGVDEATKKAAQKYLARKVPGDIATYLVLNAAYGATLGTVMNFQNPFSQQFTDAKAGLDEKGVATVAGLGGPLPGVIGDMYLAVRKAYRDADESGDAVDLNKVVNARLRKDAALVIPGGNQLINKTGIQHAFGEDNPIAENLPQGFLGDKNRGFNQSSTGKARFATPESGDLGNMLRGLVTGQFSTDQARKYFGTGGTAGDVLPGQKYNPVSKPYQDKIDPQSKILADPKAAPEAKRAAQTEIVRLVNSSRDDQDLRNKFFTDNPGAAATYKDMNATKLNKQTGKLESDVISPERYKAIQSDKSGKLIGYLRDRANKNAKEFGQPVDPLYALKDKNQINEVLALRSAFTGDDRERKAVLRKEPWFNQYEKDYSTFAQAKKTQASDPNSDFGSTPRAQEYFNLSQAYPGKTDLINQYETIRNANADEGKAFYKNNADALSADYNNQQGAALDWTNKMRKIEGAEPISQEVWDNSTYGFNDNEESLAKRLSYKYGGGYKPNYRGGGSGGGSSGGTKIGLTAASFGKAGAAPSVKITKSTAVAIKKKAKTKPKMVKMKKA